MAAEISDEPIWQLIVPRIELGEVSDNTGPDRAVGARLSRRRIVQIERVLQRGYGPREAVLPLLERRRIGPGAGGAVGGVVLGRGSRRRGGGGGGGVGGREGLGSVVALHENLLQHHVFVGAGPTRPALQRRRHRWIEREKAKSEGEEEEESV